MIQARKPRIRGKDTKYFKCFHQVGRILLNSKQNKLIKKDDLFAGSDGCVVQYITIKTRKIFNDLPTISGQLLECLN